MAAHGDDDRGEEARKPRLTRVDTGGTSVSKKQGLIYDWVGGGNDARMMLTMIVIMILIV